MNRFRGDLGDDDSYFDEGPHSRGGASRASAGALDDEVDPLDAFMAGINAEVAKQSHPKKEKPKAVWDDFEAEDGAVSYLEAYVRGETKTGFEDDGKLSDDEDLDRRNKAIEPLPALDHSQIRYNVVKTDFYQEHPEIAQLPAERIESLRSELRISAVGVNVASPAVAFAHLAGSLGKRLMEGIRKHGYSQPTPIQSQAIPVALGGRDIIGIAETGSGKTVAYLMPMLAHASDQEALKKDDGPIGIVLCPTRELAVQIETEVHRFNKQLGLRSVTLAGGLPKLEQFKEIKRGCEIVIANPGRLIDIIKMKGCNLKRTTFVVIDEADRMMHLGFEYQVRSIVQNVRPSRQTLLFSATFPPKIECLARDLLQHPVRIMIGEGGQAAANITQHIVVVKNDEEKWPWLSKAVDGMMAKGQLIVFVKSIQSAEELTQNFKDFLGKESSFLHGDLDQGERMHILKRFRKNVIPVLIATDVAARGLDIPSIATVVSYDVARDIETHTHRVGRTGRAGAHGEAFTLIVGNRENAKMAALLAEMLESLSQNLSEDLKNLALHYGPYRAAKLNGVKFDGKKKAQAGLDAKSSFGVGFDGMSLKSESAKDLERRLNREADQLSAANRRILMGSRGHGGRAGIFNPKASIGGFVSSSTSDEAAPVKQVQVIRSDGTVTQNDESSSDEDLLAPGVSARFGVKAKLQTGDRRAKRSRWS